MKFKKEQGTHNGKPNIMLSVKVEPHTDDGYEVLNIADLLEICETLFESEDFGYPKPKFLGRTMLLNAITDCHNGVPIPEIIRKYKLQKQIKPNANLSEFMGTES